MSTSDKPFKILFRCQLSHKRTIVISEMNENLLWFNEYVSSDEYKGFTQKGFALRKQDIKDFISIVREVATKNADDQRKLILEEKKILVIQSPQKNTVDIRQYVFDQRGYTGPTRKGIRLVSSNAIKLCDTLNKYLSGEPMEALNEKAVTAPEPVTNTELPPPNEKHLSRAFDVHGKKCYICQAYHIKALNNLTLYYADGNSSNDDDNNVYPICKKCLEKV